MPYVNRNPAGHIVAMFAREQYDGQEFREAAELWVDSQLAIDAAKQSVREVREKMLNRLAGIALAANLSGDTATTDAYIVARQGLLDITKDLPATLPEVTTAIATRYVAIAITARATSPTLADAFNQVDA
jgi:hypothetical protein